MPDRLRLNEGNRKWWTLGAMCFALFMIMLDNTVVNVALPSIERDLGSSLSSLEWVINGYTLAFAVFLATGGRLGDIFGRRLTFLIGVTLFSISSATAGFAPDSAWLVGSRVVQGIGGALMMPATLSIVTNAFPPAERGKAIGTWAGVSALALAVGREVDYAGVATLTVALTALVLALIEGNSWGWTSTSIVALFSGSVAALAAFVLVESRVSAPMVEVPLFGSRN